MGNYHKPTKTKTSGTGGKKVAAMKKKLRYCGSEPTYTKVSEKETRVLRNATGNAKKVKLKTAAYANVATKDGKIVKAKIKKVTDTPDNPHYTRQNILTKGGVIDTEIGPAKITNRVGQDGVVNAKLI
ncbi:MAG: 30S ribosomal protein S8e [Candidatus Micrarchaeota archaeon]